MNQAQTLTGDLVKVVVGRYLESIVALGALFFLPAGTLAYWQAWVYLAILFVPMTFIMVYLMKYDPELLARRMRTREKVAEQKVIVALSFIPFLIAFLLPGFDQRFNWSHVPAWLVIAADGLVLFGYLIVFLVFRENRYASRVIEVAQGQSVIRSGPYSVVRHPMYLGCLLMYVFSPLALGSYWAMIPAALILPVMVARTLNEEKILARDLNGYQDYMRTTRYRLLPGIW